MRNTPTPVGYLVAVEVAVAVTAVALLVDQGAWTDPFAWAYAALLTQLVALVVAPVGVVAVHLCCRRARDQRVHVGAAGLAGLLAGAAFHAWVASGVDGLRFGWAMVLCVGIGAALGRAVVAPPWVRSRSGSAGSRSAAPVR